MYKYCTGLLPPVFDEMFKTNSDNHEYNTRHASDLQYPKNQLAFGNKSICYQGVEIWNNIPNHIRNSQNLNCFKNAYKDCLISHYNNIIWITLLYFLFFYLDLTTFVSLKNAILSIL